MSKCIVCDIQPQYSKFIDFSISDFIKYLEQQDDILFFYVGRENSGIGNDTKYDVIDWLVDNELPLEVIDRITFIEKGYGFFRQFMDSYYDDDKLIELVKYMIDNKLNDSRELEDVEKIEYFELLDTPENIYMPDFDKRDINCYEGAELIGGGFNECLKELRTYFEALNFKYKLNMDYVYGY